MSIRVNVTPVFSTGIPQVVELPDGARVSDAGKAVGAPSGAMYRVNGEPKTLSDTLGNGDNVMVTQVKFDAGR